MVTFIYVFIYLNLTCDGTCFLMYQIYNILLKNKIDCGQWEKKKVFIYINISEEGILEL